MQKYLLLLIVVIFQSCYSFTGSSLDPRIETIYIAKFPNYAPLQNSNLSQEFTLALQEVFANRTSLNLTNTEDSDIVIEGTIIGYNVTPIAVISGDQAAQNRLTVQVQVIYQNIYDEEAEFKKTYTAFEDFAQTANLQQIEDGLVEEINARLVEQIFNDIVANW